MSLAQWHHAVPPVRLEPVALRSRTKHSRYHEVTTFPKEYISLYIGLLTFSVSRTHQDNVGLSRLMFNTASELIERERERESLGERK